jgi:hypothetical protein
MKTFEPASLISWGITALVCLGLAYLALVATRTYVAIKKGGHSDGFDNVLRQVAADLTAATAGVWHFFRPILQLLIVIGIIYFIINQLGFSQDMLSKIVQSDIKTVLAFLVIGAFCLSAFLSDNPASWLKDLALVVIGFYFGSKV